ncbi:efflux RND transporter periplasmic adaptor subunit [Jannaschia sp. Os4]|uniref:efflux RND transporter periplasmic adaptor subunit n=1 Tax=Jannaschia sp. Os4 TaxID=2807617 RepID=UPI001939BD2D|nr:efflux RND transporter periplasmic adaptor subunit [Jannaschia sp. Os4]MBM2577053.1 efflux RND transporter periplasmic adaptor subunit [Jannaschia sp. Os4]
MRLFPVLTAIIVCVVLFYAVLQRDVLLGFVAEVTGEEAPEVEVVSEAEPVSITAAGDAEARVLPSVVALASAAQVVPDVVLLRGQTEAARQVTVAAETSGLVVSEPLPRGTRVEAGQLLCELDPGTRVAVLAEAQARLAEARARVPEAEARVAEAIARRPESDARVAEAAAALPAARARVAEAEAAIPAAAARLREAEARLPEMQARVAVAEASRADAQARVAEAEARLEEARINLNAAERLGEDGFASQTRVANAQAAFRAAEAGLTAALTGVDSVEADIEAARAAVEGARAGIENARSQVSGAEAALESARSQVAGAEAAIENARAGVTGAEAGVESARAGIEGSTAGIQAAEAGVEAAQAEIDRLTITAPFGGVLESDTAELGTLLQPGTACATILQLDPIELVGFVAEGDVDRVEVGARAGAQLLTGREVTGTVRFLGRQADPVTRTFRVEVEVPNPDLRIRDGQTVEMLIETQPTRAHLIPASALTLDDAGRLGVRIVEDGRVTFVPTELVRDTPDGVLLAGLPDTADVIVVGQEYVTEGVEVEVAYRDAPVGEAPSAAEAATDDPLIIPEVTQ